ncbi:putative inactive purple acid phosphatase 29 [Acorus calamus]|uniref:Inactive purple acid phosphatase 29 n=1 Tax=Acorus calamus TaxID=4465 RepID=A0AAV9D7B7_ACOCL|nr:putative inactive purple acid phosphatase 29 [Acorus calamus]
MDRLSLFVLACLCLASPAAASVRRQGPPSPLRFGRSGEFKILQVADMHYANGESTPCEDVLPDQFRGCSDLNTSAFLRRMIRAERPDLVVFTGDNIFGSDSTNSTRSLESAFAPVIEAGLPWAAVLGNHDQEGTLSREGVMRHVAGMRGTLSRVNPEGVEIDGYGNYHVEVQGAVGSVVSNKSVVNLYFLDSGDYTTVAGVGVYGWIKASQQVWFKQTSERLQREYMKEPEPQNEPAPGLVYFHIPLPEFASFDSSNYTGVGMDDGVGSASVNSGFFTAMLEAGDVKGAFVGHDHINDYCGELTGINLCYAGGFGYHAYGKAGWPRRARVVSASLEKAVDGGWGGVESIKTWKRLDDEELSTIDVQVIWTKG